MATHPASGGIKQKLVCSTLSQNTCHLIFLLYQYHPLHDPNLPHGIYVYPHHGYTSSHRPLLQILQVIQRQLKVVPSGLASKSLSIVVIDAGLTHMLLPASLLSLSKIILGYLASLSLKSLHLSSCLTLYRLLDTKGLQVSLQRPITHTSLESILGSIDLHTQEFWAISGTSSIRDVLY
jgi:hypothetical protein